MEWIKDFWRCGIVHADAASIIARGSLDDLPISWLPGTRGLTYLADPFGLWRDGRFYVFVEKYDYIGGVGQIDVLTLDEHFVLLSRKTVVREPWHLSYPYVFEADGDTWMLPEAHRSGTSWLYRAVAFPDQWIRSHEIVLPRVPLDATIARHDDRWWLFYAASEPAHERLTALYAAHAHSLAGPWIEYGGGPIFRDPAGARPGGTPIMYDGMIHLPVQRCTGSYGSGLRLLRFQSLSPTSVRLEKVAELSTPSCAAPFDAGCHTLAEAGRVTLIDVKRRRLSPLALAAWPLRRARNQFA